MAPTRRSKSTSICLQEIVTLLKEKCESLASCRTRLSLTCNEVQEICCSLYSSSLQSSTLIRLLANVKAIRILPELTPSVNVLESTINLSPFHELTHLEVRNVTILRVIHLSQLRSQLVHLALHGGCVNILDEVLLQCGGDQCTDSFLWSELHSLHITSCHTIDLGTGLHLAPWLKTLDLSFNQLTDSSLQSLSSLLTLHSLVLNFNSLQRIPFLAPSARTSLKVLHLRQNQLESLFGVEQLHSIEELDVAYNCISKGEALSSLSSLTHLVKLNLEFNPISYGKDYRHVVLQRVSPSINRKKFQLDNKPLSAVDIALVGTITAMYINPPLILIKGDETPATASVPSAGQFKNDNSRLAVPSPLLLNSSFEAVSVTPTTPSSSLSTMKRRKASRMREVEIADSVHRFSEGTTAEAAITEPVENNGNMGHLQTKQQVEELRRVFGQENWLTSQAGNQVRLLLGWQDVGSTSDSEAVATEAIKNDCVVLEPESEPSIPYESGSPLSHSKDDEDSDDLYVFVVQRQINNSENLEERLFTVSATYLCEKDVLNGATIVCWKRSSLQTLTLLQTTSSTVKVQFSFNSLASNEPIYVMEQEDYQELEQLVATGQNTSSNSADSCSTNVGLKVDMSCLKCDQKFPSTRAAVRLRTAVSSPLLKGQLEEYSVCPYCGSDMVFTIDHQQQTKNVSGSESSMSSASSNQSGSDVIIATNDPYLPGSDTSTEGSTEVMYKISRLATSMDDACSTPNVDNTKSAAKSISSHSYSSKSNRSNKSTNLTCVKSSPSFPQYTYSYADFSQVDHRLRLYCEMFLLSHHSEEFHGLIKVELVTMNSGPTDNELTPYPALLVVTSHKVYFLRIASCYSEQPEKWLNLESSYPLSQLVNIMTVIGNQGLVLKFGTTTSRPHLVLLRDQRRTRNVTLFLTDVYQKSGLTAPDLRTDLMTDQWLALDGFVRGDQQSTSDDVETADTAHSDNNSRVFLFCITCRVEWDNSHQQQQSADYDNTALMVTNDRMALVRGDPRWLASHQVQFRTWGVSLISLQQFVNLVNLESFICKPEKIKFYFLDETSGIEERWTVTFATREAIDQLIEAVRHPWEAVFSVELEINELDE